jgi:hypothetical protein
MFTSGATPQGGFLLYSHDSGRSWQKSTWKKREDSILTSGNLYIRNVRETSSQLFGLLGFPGVFCTSPDSGKTWEIIRSTLLNTSNIEFLAKEFVILDTSFFAIRGGDGLYQSRDYGKTWESISLYLLIYPQEKFFNYGVALGVTIVDQNLSIITSDSYRLISADKGKTWINKTDNYRIPLPTAAKPEESGVIQLQPGLFLALQRVRNSSLSTYSYWLSNDSGRVWRPFKLSDSIEIFFKYITIGKTLFLATSKGIFSSYDNGQTWFKESGTDELPNGEFYSNMLEFFLYDTTLYVLVAKKGFYQANITPLITNVQQRSNYSTRFLSLTVPNPTADFTDISFTLPRASHTHLSLYSTLGTEVWRNEGGVLPAGEQRLRIDTRGLPSGVYMYRLTAGGVSSVGRIVLVR